MKIGHHQTATSKQRSAPATWNWPTLLGINRFHRRDNAIDLHGYGFAEFACVINSDLPRAAHVSTYLRPGEIIQCRDADVANLFSAALENAKRVLKGSAVVESEIDVVRVNRDVEYAVPQPIRRTVADSHGAVSVVYVFIAWRHLLEYQRAQLQCKTLNRAIIRLKKPDEFWRWWMAAHDS